MLIWVCEISDIYRTYRTCSGHLSDIHLAFVIQIRNKDINIDCQLSDRLINNAKFSVPQGIQAETWPPQSAEQDASRARFYFGG